MEARAVTHPACDTRRCRRDKDACASGAAAVAAWYAFAASAARRCMLQEEGAGRGPPALSGVGGVLVVLSTPGGAETSAAAEFA